MTIKIYTQNLHIPYFSSKLSLPRKFELVPIHGFVLPSPHISQVITLIISLTYIKSCWGNFEFKIFYLGFTSPLCTIHSHPIIVNLYCNIFTKRQPSSSPSRIHSFDLFKDDSILTDEVYLLSKEIHFEKVIRGVKNF